MLTVRLTKGVKRWKSRKEIIKYDSELKRDGVIQIFIYFYLFIYLYLFIHIYLFLFIYLFVFIYSYLFIFIYFYYLFI
jgi:hypothetical protein